MAEETKPRGPCRPALSTTTFTMLFLALGLVLFSAVGAWMLQRMEAVQHLAREADREAAEEELARAARTTLERVSDRARALARWDEARQQLVDPTYYAYWRSSRALAGGPLPDFVAAVELYGKEGRPLMRYRAGSPVADRLPAETAFVRKGPEGAFLYRFTSIPPGADASARKGYAGIKVRFTDALLTLNRFRYADPESIHLEAAAGERIGPEALPGRLAYRLMPRTNTQPLEGVMAETLTHFAVLAAVLALVYFVLVRQLFARPMTLLDRHIDALRRGRQTALSEPEGRSLPVAEMERLRCSLNDYQRELEELHHDLDRKNAELWDLAHHDSLTHVHNRRAYDEHWQALLRDGEALGTGLAVMLLDCDHFKAINDTYGHRTGDRVLNAVAGTLAETIRREDRIYRLGGDEFAILAWGVDEQEAETLAWQALNAVNRYPFAELGIREPVRFSIGLAHAPGDDPAALQQLHRQADVAMYRAKRPGRGKVVRYHQETVDGADALISNRYLEAVHGAVENGEGIRLHYQPVAPLAAGADGFYEVLARLEDPQGLIMPAQFFPVVEGQQLDTEFDLAVLNAVGRRLASGELPAGTGLSINLAPTSLLDRQAVAAIQALQPHLAHYRIILEVTETTLVVALREASETLRRLRSQGFAIALDDFGSGYSSLRYLSVMPVDIVKFDMALVHDLQGERRHRLIALEVAQMILKAGYQLVAEGIESQMLLGETRRIGFTHAQGFHIGRPAPDLAPEPLSRTGAD